MATRRIPKYRRFKPKDLGLVVIDGKQHYVGKYGTPGSIAEYNRLVQEWLARETRGAAVRARPPVELTIGELILRFWEGFAEGHYRRPDGMPTGELDNYRDSLRRLYGVTRAGEFGPLALKAVRQSIIDDGLARSTINQRIGRVVRIFKWAVAEELLALQVHQALSAVPGLQRGAGPRRASRSRSARPPSPTSRPSGPSSRARSGRWSRCSC